MQTIEIVERIAQDLLDLEDMADDAMKAADPKHYRDIDRVKQLVCQAQEIAWKVYSQVDADEMDEFGG